MSYQKGPSDNTIIVKKGRSALSLYARQKRIRSTKGAWPRRAKDVDEAAITKANETRQSARSPEQITRKGGKGERRGYNTPWVQKI